jgi:hypothetical protein
VRGAPDTKRNTATLIIVRVAVIAVCAVALRADAAIPTYVDRSGVRYSTLEQLGRPTWPLVAAADPDRAYPIISNVFEKSDNPFHMTVASLVARGAKLQPRELMENFWSQGWYEQTQNQMPVYVASPTDPAYMISCTYYGKKGCSANGVTVRFPANAKAQTGTDHHITSVDPKDRIEVDMWGGGDGVGADGQPGGKCTFSGQVLDCSWGGMYPFAGKGLGNSGQSAVHGGYAVGLFTITAQELLQGRIDHALGIAAACLDNPTVYPADVTTGSDYPCSDGHGKTPSAQYGQNIHLKLTPAQIAALGYSKPCTTVLTALSVYGAYTYDDGNGGLQILMENALTYGPVHNPWYDIIYPQMVAAGEGKGTGPNWTWRSCFDKLKADDFEIYTMPNLGY